MSRQFRFYLLPSDIERLAAELRVRYSANFIDTVSSCLAPTQVDSPIRRIIRDSGQEVSSVHCYLVQPTGADIRTWYMQKRKLWAIDEASEVIQFSGCDFDGSVLLVGRFYFQTDLLIDNSIWPKRREFLDWAGKIFRTTKRLLKRSKAMDAYVGEDAARWRQGGGRFATLIRAGGVPFYEVED
jgi:hypothetical protein